MNLKKPQLGIDKNSRYKQGWYVLKHPEKYLGNPQRIRYMSSWELEVHSVFDNNPNVLRWSSENIVIPYIKPTDGKIHRYLPDYYVEYINVRGELCKEIVEVKPKKQMRRSRSRKPKQKLIEDIEFAINTAKWKAASEFCTAKGLTFRIIHEGDTFR